MSWTNPFVASAEQEEKDGGCQEATRKCSDTDLAELMSSVYPLQARDYILLKLPQQCNDQQSSGATLPCDYKLANLVQLLWNRGICTCGLDQGYKPSRQGHNSTERHWTEFGCSRTPTLPLTLV